MEKFKRFNLSYYWNLLIFVLLLSFIPLLIFSIFSFSQAQIAVKQKIYTDFTHVIAIENEMLQEILTETRELRTLSGHIT